MSRTEDMSSDLFGGDESIGVGLRNVSLECGLSDKVLDAGLGKWVSEERFRKEDDELDVSMVLVVVGNNLQVFGIPASSVVGGRGSSWRECCESASKVKAVEYTHVA